MTQQHIQHDQGKPSQSLPKAIQNSKSKRAFTRYNYWQLVKWGQNTILYN